MNKSIEEQALEYSNQKDHEADNNLDYGYGAPLRKGYIAGTKARDAEIEQLKAENLELSNMYKQQIEKTIR